MIIVMTTEERRKVNTNNFGKNDTRHPYRSFMVTDAELRTIRYSMTRTRSDLSLSHNHKLSSGLFRKLDGKFNCSNASDMYWNTQIVICIKFSVWQLSLRYRTINASVISPRCNFPNRTALYRFILTPLVNASIERSFALRLTIWYEYEHIN